MLASSSRFCLARSDRASPTAARGSFVFGVEDLRYIEHGPPNSRIDPSCQLQRRLTFEQFRSGHHQQHAGELVDHPEKTCGNGNRGLLVGSSSSSTDGRRSSAPQIVSSVASPPDES